MAEGSQAGTPETKPDGTESGGTPGESRDGSERADIKASPELVSAWKAKAEAANKLEEKVKTLEQQLREQQSRPVHTPTTDAVSEHDRVLFEQAQMGNPLAIETLRNRAEMNMSDAIDAANVPHEYRAHVKGIIRQSGYMTTVQDALRMARGGEVDTLAEQLKRLQEENEALKREQKEGRTRVPGTSATVVPAGDAPAFDDETMPHSQYLAALAKGGPAAAALKAKKDSGKLKLDWNA